MDHTDHVNLIRGGLAQPNGIWADLGSGGGAFTLALADLLSASTSAQIYSIDRDASALDQQLSAMRQRFPNQTVTYLNADFTRKLDLPPLDGLIMANSLHFVRHKEPVLEFVRGYLKPGGHLILVEYNVDRGNTWVPYPMSFETWRELANKNSFKNTRLLHVRPSRFLNEIYSALSIS
jgi:SAM-dependent methyltransferase